MPIWKRLQRLINGEIAFGFFCAGLFWMAVLGWVTSFTPTTQEKESCYQAAAKTGSDTNGCKSFWEKTSSDPVALFTLVLAFANIGMWFATIGLYQGNKSQLRLARDEFLSSHRPRMRLKHMWLTHDTAWRMSGPLEFNLDIVNIGNTEGFITWINYTSILLPPGQRLPQRPPYDEMPFGPHVRITRFRTNTTLAPGITLAREVCDGALDHHEIQDILWGRTRLYLIGTIEYFDQRGGLRQTGFCRRFTYNAYPPAVGDYGRLDVESDPDYEFEEWGD
jgi:hypothetical protein